MYRVCPLSVRLVLVLCGAAFCFWAATPAPAQMVRKLTFDELVQKSDQVFVARCVDKKAVFEDGSIVTHYKLRPSEVWKGELATNASGELEMDELGGELKNATIPIGQRVGGSADMVSGEEVLLFTALGNKKNTHGAQATAKAGQAAAKPLLDPNKPHIVGAWQGRFTVMSHPTSGGKLVARASRTTIPGAPIEPDVQQLMIATNPDPQAADGLMQMSDPVQTAKLMRMAKDIDRTAKKAKAERDARARVAPAEASAIYQFESLESVKARVLKRVAETRNKENTK